MVRVWDIQLEELTWACDDVISICYIIPGNENSPTATNPLPLAVRQAETGDERQRRFNAEFEPTDKCSWVITSLLLPPDDTIDRIVNVELESDDVVY